MANSQNFEAIPLLNSRKKLSNDQRQEILGALMINFHKGKLHHGAFVSIADIFHVNERTVRRKFSIVNGRSVDVSRRFSMKSGRTQLAVNFNDIKGIPLPRRTNIRSLATELELSTSTLHGRIAKGELVPHSNALKPHLTENNKKVRLQFCLSMLEKENLNTSPVFKDMFDVIHIDEKWFYMTKESEKYYLHPDEEQPVRTCKSKKFIVKVMFLAAVARPRYDYCCNLMFDGKIGIFPFTMDVPARRNSKNRVAGTLETKPMVSVTREVYQRCLIDHVLPAIRAKWPDGDATTIFIQQDNAKPHIDPMDVEFIEAVKECGMDIRLMFQPPNSPDMNVLGLGFFRAIQSLQHQVALKTIDELVSAVKSSFDILPHESLNSVFLTLQQCMVEVMKNFGANAYKIPHMGKK